MFVIDKYNFFLRLIHVTRLAPIKTQFIFCFFKGPQVSILVTGVNGMIGYPMALKFARLGRQVIGLDIEIPSELEDFGIQLIKADITQAELINDIIASKGINSILHAGGISGPMLHKDDPYKVFNVNSKGTLNIAEAARKHGIQRIVFLSTFVAYGEQDDISVVDESRIQRGSNPYAASKISAENILRSYREYYKLETVSLRLGAVYGPRRTTDCLIRSLLRNSMNPKIVELNFGKNWSRPYVYIEDIINAIRLAFEAPFSKINQNAYNISGGIWPTISEIADIVADITQTKNISLRHGRTPNDYRIGPLNIEAAHRDLNFKPIYSMKSGIESYYTWLKDNEF